MRNLFPIKTSRKVILFLEQVISCVRFCQWMLSWFPWFNVLVPCSLPNNTYKMTSNFFIRTFAVHQNCCYYVNCCCCCCCFSQLIFSLEVKILSSFALASRTNQNGCHVQLLKYHVCTNIKYVHYETLLTDKNPFKTMSTH